MILNVVARLIDGLQEFYLITPALLENGDSYLKNVRYDFYKGSYLPPNVTIVNVVLRDLDLHFQGKIYVLIYLL